MRLHRWQRRFEEKPEPAPVKVIMQDGKWNPLIDPKDRPAVLPPRKEDREGMRRANHALMAATLNTVAKEPKWLRDGMPCPPDYRGHK